MSGYEKLWMTFWIMVFGYLAVESLNECIMFCG